MTTMLDKMAVAMARMDDCDPAAITNPRYWGLARAALQAIRGEDEELDRVVSRAAWHSGSGQKARNVRTAMIDAILSEQPES